MTAPKIEDVLYTFVAGEALSVGDYVSIDNKTGKVIRSRLGDHYFAQVKADYALGEVIVLEATNANRIRMTRRVERPEDV